MHPSASSCLYRSPLFHGPIVEYGTSDLKFSSYKLIHENRRKPLREIKKTELIIYKTLINLISNCEKPLMALTISAGVICIFFMNFGNLYYYSGTFLTR